MRRVNSHGSLGTAALYSRMPTMQLLDPALVLVEDQVGQGRTHQPGPGHAGLVDRLVVGADDGPGLDHQAAHGHALQHRCGAVLAHSCTSLVFPDFAGQCDCSAGSIGAGHGGP